jgi:hypothetical protein
VTVTATLIILSKDQICPKCHESVPRGKIAVAHSKSHGIGTTYYHPEHYTYANGEAILNTEDCSIRQYGRPPIPETSGKR